MKIMQIMPEFLFGGAEIMCENLSYGLKELGQDVVVVSLYDLDTPITQRMKANNIKVVSLQKKKGLDLSIIPKLRKLIKNEKPDVLHTHRYVTAYTVPAALGLNIRQIHTLHSVAQKENGYLGKKLNKFFFHKCGVVPVALSEIVKDTVVNVYNISAEKIPVVYNGIPLSNYSQKSTYDLSSPIRVLHIGRFTEAKNHNVLLQALRNVHEKNNDVVLTLVGDGELKIDIMNMIKDYNMESYVHCLGTLDNVNRVLNDSDIFLLPSVYEGMPMTLIEAMATGMPIIASRVGGIPNMVKDHFDALLIEPEVDELVDAIFKLIKQPDTRRYLGQNAIESSAKFSSLAMAKGYLSLYHVKH